MTFWIGHHRRYTANHTWHVDLGDRSLFVKANPDRVEASAERDGYHRLRSHYPVPRLHRTCVIAGWTVHAYERYTGVRQNRGLLLDEISRCERTGSFDRLDTCVTEILRHYRETMASTLRLVPASDTAGKLYRDRAAPGGRLSAYYAGDHPLLNLGRESRIRPSDLRSTSIVVNGRDRPLDFDDALAWVRQQLDPDQAVWAVITQGDPTDFNLGWSPTGGPVWFDYDTAGLNSLAGEFACFLLYQRLHGAWLTPRYNPPAYRDHPAALRSVSLPEPIVQVDGNRSRLTVAYRHIPTAARRYVMRRYLNDLVIPLATHLSIDDLVAWLRPYLIMRLLAVYNLGRLRAVDCAFCLALLGDVLDPDVTIGHILSLTDTRTEAA